MERVCERDEANRERGGWDALRLCEKLARGPRVQERGTTRSVVGGDPRWKKLGGTLNECCCKGRV